MSQEEKTKRETEDSHLRNLVKKVVESFDTIVRNETDPTNILLKGHLLVENFLDELVAILDVHQKKSVHRSSFAGKIKSIEKDFEENSDKKRNFIKQKFREIAPALYALNEVRNNLAHNYTFELSEPEVDKIGNNLGSKYILQKYDKNYEDLKRNLSFCIQDIIEKIGFIIYDRIRDLTKENREGTGEEKKG